MLDHAKRILFVILLVAIVAPVLMAVSTTKPSGFTETGVSNGNGDWQHLRGSFACFIWGTFDGGDATVETLVTGTTAAPTKLKDVSVSELVGVTTETPWVGLGAGDAYYRIVITGGGGSESVNWHCRVIQR